MRDYMAKALRALVSAGQLLDDGDPDGAVNRAYYAMFDAAKAALDSLGHNAAELSSKHSGLINKFGELVVVPGLVDRDTGSLLQQAFRARQIADYEASSIPLERAERIVADADHFVQTLRHRLDLDAD